jgi:hypothetical protein
MARSLSTALRSHLEGNSFVFVKLVKLATTGGTQYLTDAPFDITYDANVYSAQGTFLGITDAEEQADVIVSKSNIILSAIESGNMSTYAQSSMINQAVEIYIAYLNPTNNAIIGDPILTFKGKVVGYNVQDARKTATISLECANSFANFEKTNGRKTNEGSFQQEHPTDRSMEFTDQMFDFNWGRS